MISPTRRAPIWVFALLACLCLTGVAQAATLKSEDFETYRQLLLRLEAEDSRNAQKRMIALLDMTGDGVPELIDISCAKSGSTGRMAIYETRNGQIRALESSSALFDFDQFSFPGLSTASLSLHAAKDGKPCLVVNLKNKVGSTTYYSTYAFASAGDGSLAVPFAGRRAVKSGRSAYLVGTRAVSYTQYKKQYAALTKAYPRKGSIAGTAIGRTDSAASVVSKLGAQANRFKSLTSASSVALNKTSLSLRVGAGYSLSARVSPSTAFQDKISWASSNPSVAQVDEGGRVSAVGIGKATIRARAESGRYRDCKVTVLAPYPKAVSLPETLQLARGKTLTLAPVVAPENAVRSFAYKSYNTKVATVNSRGVVTGRAVGKATIAVKTSNGKLAKCVVTVTVPATSVSLSATSKTLAHGGNAALSAKVSPSAAEQRVSWSSDNPSVATVNEQGVVQAFSAGTALISAAASNGVKASCRVTVLHDTQSGLIIDISHYNPVVDWEKLSAAADLIILRATCGTSKDNRIDQYAAECNRRGIPFGVYCYAKATNVVEAEAEADALYRAAAKYNPLFYVYDAEIAGLNDQICSAFVNKLRALGANKVGYYIAHHRYKSYKLKTSKVDFIWIPRYGDNSGAYEIAPAYACDLHQFTSRGRVPGISGNVDINRLTGRKPLSWFLERD